MSCLCPHAVQWQYASNLNDGNRLDASKLKYILSYFNETFVVLYLDTFLCGYDGTNEDKQPREQQSTKPVIASGPTEYLVPHAQLEFGHSIARVAYPYADPYIGVAAYGAQAMEGDIGGPSLVFSPPLGALLLLLVGGLCLFFCLSSGILQAVQGTMPNDQYELDVSLRSSSNRGTVHMATKLAPCIGISIPIPMLWLWVATNVLCQTLKYEIPLNSIISSFKIIFINGMHYWPTAYPPLFHRTCWFERNNFWERKFTSFGQGLGYDCRKQLPIWVSCLRYEIDVTLTENTTKGFVPDGFSKDFVESRACKILASFTKILRENPSRPRAFPSAIKHIVFEEPSLTCNDAEYGLNYTAICRVQVSAVVAWKKLPQARMPLPLDMTEEEPVYVNAKQYHGILRRRQSRAKAESENKLIKTRKPYLHESRHRHAMKRARGCGGRFLNTKKLEESKSNVDNEKASEGNPAQAGSSSGSEVLQSENGNVNSVQEVQGASGLSGSEVTSMSQSRANDKLIVCCNPIDTEARPNLAIFILSEASISSIGSLFWFAFELDIIGLKSEPSLHLRGFSWKWSDGIAGYIKGTCFWDGVEPSRINSVIQCVRFIWYYLWQFILGWFVFSVVTMVDFKNIVMWASSLVVPFDKKHTVVVKTQKTAKTSLI
eukprot:Gb_14803 [translate_table: standard]